MFPPNNNSFCLLQAGNWLESREQPFNLKPASKDKLLTFGTYSPNAEVLYTKYDSTKAFSLKIETIF